MNSLVSVDWLAAHLGDRNVVVLDASLPLVGVQPVVDVRQRYRERHVPGAVFFDIEALSDGSSGLPHTLPSAASFAESMGALGVGDAMTIVVYEQGSVFAAPRAWWMLRVMGAPDVQVLDGGLQAWVQAGHATKSGEEQRPRASFHAVLNKNATRSLEEVRDLVAKGMGAEQILDARSAGRFLGTAPEPRAGLPSGHMPGSINVPYTELLEDGRLKQVEALREVFRARGVAFQRPITTSCGSGVTAAVLALGLAQCGVEGVRLYDGSWAEYAQQPDAEIHQQSGCFPDENSDRKRVTQR